MKVRINESQLHSIICECVRKELLKEGLFDKVDSFAYILKFDGELKELLMKNGINVSKEWEMIEKYLYGLNGYKLIFVAKRNEEARDYAYEPLYFADRLWDDDGLEDDIKNIPDEMLRKKMLNAYNDIVEFAADRAEIQYKAKNRF